MSETTLRARISQAQSSDSSGGARVYKSELEGIWREAKSAEAGDPAGRPITQGEAKLVAELKSASLTKGAKDLYAKISAELPSLVQSATPPPAGHVVNLSNKSGEVFLTAQAGFAADAAGTVPRDAVAMTKVLYGAGNFIQGSFGSKDNLFAKAGLGLDGKRAVLAQIAAQLDTSLEALSHQQVDQMLGAAGATLVELLKSVMTPSLGSPTVAEQNKSLRKDIFAAIEKALDHPRMNVRIRRALVGYMHKSTSVQAELEPAHKATLQTRFEAHHPRRPFDYAKWEADKKSVIKIDHACGEGEGFLFGFVKQLQSRGLGQSGSRHAMQLVSGDIRRGPAVLSVTVGANDPMNKWGRDMTVEINVREFRNDMYKAMADANVDVVSYGGHSNFGGNTLASLEKAPAQVGDKVICRDLCCGIDTTNAEARLYPEGSENSVTSVNSSYFRITKDKTEGDYASESEGYDMLMVLMRGVLAKKEWGGIGGDLESQANWHGHDSKNNWIFPGDARRDAARDDNNNGIPNVFDVMPAVDTTDVPASTAREFELTLPTTPVSKLGAGRAFQALQFVNTATNYNPEFAGINSGRKLVPSPQGLWFDGAEAPNEYVRIGKAADGKFHVQLSSALSDMTMETTRAVLYFEAAKFFAREDPGLFKDQKERLAMALCFTASSLIYDQAWRDAPVFDGLKRLYGIPATVSYDKVKAAVEECDARHNYTGDRQAVKKLVDAFGPALAAAKVGEPALTVTA